MTVATERAIARQVELERDMRQRGFAKALRQVNDDGQYDKGAFKAGLLGPYIADTEKTIADTCLDYLGKAGNPSPGVRRLLVVDPEKSAAITLDCCLSAITNQTTIMRLALQIGRCVETQHKLEVYQDHDKKRFNWLYKEALRRSSNAARQRYGLLHAMAEDGVPHSPWSREEVVSAGFLLIDAAIRATGIVQQETVYKDKRFTSYIKGTQKAHELMQDMLLHKISSTTQYGPLVCPPLPWHKAWGRYVGAYYTPEIQIPLVKTKSRNFKNVVTHHDMEEHVAAVNALMATPYQVDVEALHFAQYLLDSENPLLPVAPKELPERYEGDDPKELAKWKAAAREIHEWNAKLDGKKFQTSQILMTAWEYSQEKEIYFAVNLDFRGRMNYYTGGSLLNPQGGDLSKSLIRFAKPSLCEGAAWSYFLIHGANEFGVKGTLEDKIRWSNEDSMILASAAKPTEFTWWQEADKPLCFLRWCRDYARALECHMKGKPFYTHLPIHMDGTCNGIQHLAAMTRDAKAAAAVNMLPTDKPKDMYLIVADKIRDGFQTLSDPIDIEYALMWLQFGWDRNLTKRQCMTKSYGATMRSCTSYTKDYVDDGIEKGKPDVFGKHRHQAVLWMAQRIWDTINELVTGPQETMEWLKTVAREYNRQGVTMEWTTPTGFLVHHYYPEWKSRQVKCFIDGREMKPRMREEEHGSISKTDVVNGISANYTHSHDAAHLARIILRMRDLGHSVWAIHDSIGVQPAAAADLARVIRETFVELYETSPLNGLAKEAQRVLGESNVPPVPAMGDLDLRDIMSADYFFS